jgi:hypothetical protein
MLTSDQAGGYWINTMADDEMLFAMTPELEEVCRALKEGSDVANDPERTDAFIAEVDEWIADNGLDEIDDRAYFAVLARGWRWSASGCYAWMAGFHLQFTRRATALLDGERKRRGINTAN